MSRKHAARLACNRRPQRPLANHGPAIGEHGRNGVPAQHVTEDRLVDVALEAGADDVAAAGKAFEVTCDPAKFEEVAAALKEARIPTDAAEVTRVATSKVELGLEDARRIVALINVLEDHEDVQSVTANYSIPEEILETVLAGLE